MNKYYIQMRFSPIRLYNPISPFIINTKKPICKNCIYFIEPVNKHKYIDELPLDSIGECRKFGSANLVTGKVEYDIALISRKNKFKCGEDGIYFVSNK